MGPRRRPALVRRAPRSSPFHLEPLEPRCLLSGFVGPGDIDPNDIRIGRAIVVDVDQSFYLTIARASRKLEVARHAPDGSLLWSHTLRTNLPIDAGSALALRGAANGVVVAGAFKGTVDFDLTDATFTLSSGRKPATFLACYDQTGALVWARAISADPGAGLNGRFEPAALAVRDGRIVLAGSLRGSIDADPGAGLAPLSSQGRRDLAVLQFDSDGQWQSAQVLGGPGNDQARDVAIDSADRVYLAGQFKQTIDVDPGVGVTTLSSAGGGDGLIVRLTAAGALDFAGQIGGRGDDDLTHLALSSADELWLGGHFSREADIDPTASSRLASSAAKRDLFLAKLQTDTTLAFTGTMPARGQQWLSGLAIAPDDSLLLTAPHTQGMDLDPTDATFTLPADADGIFALRLQADGNLQTAAWIGGGLFEITWDLAADTLNQVWLLGNTLGRQTDFDPGPGVVHAEDDGVFVCTLDEAAGFVDVLLV